MNWQSKETNEGLAPLRHRRGSAHARGSRARHEVGPTGPARSAAEGAGSLTLVGYCLGFWTWNGFGGRIAGIFEKLMISGDFEKLVEIKQPWFNGRYSQRDLRFMGRRLTTFLCHLHITKQNFQIFGRLWL